MKKFFGTFAITLILCYIFLFFGGALIFESLYGVLILIAFIIAIFITIFVNQETRIEELEVRIKTLESQIDSKSKGNDIMKKYIIGTLSVVPPVYIIAFIVFAVNLVLNVPNDEWTGMIFPYLFITHMLVMILNLFLLITFARHIFTNKRLSVSKRFIWCGLFFITFTIAMPIYWLIHIRNDMDYRLI